MGKEVKVTQIASYDGHSIKASGNVTLNLKARYCNLVNTLKITQLLNNDVTILAKTDKVNKLGTFMVNQISIDHDGESKIKLTSIKDFVEIDVLGSMVGSEDIKFLFKANIDLEDEGNGNV